MEVFSSCIDIKHARLSDCFLELLWSIARVIWSFWYSCLFQIARACDKSSIEQRILLEAGCKTAKALTVDMSLPLMQSLKEPRFHLLPIIASICSSRRNSSTKHPIA